MPYTKKTPPRFGKGTGNVIQVFRIATLAVMFFHKNSGILILDMLVSSSFFLFVLFSNKVQVLDFLSCPRRLSQKFEA